MFSSIFTRFTTDVKPEKIRLKHSDDIVSGLALAGFRLTFSRDRKGNLWVTGLPLSVFVAAAQNTLKAYGYTVRRSDIRSCVLALAYQSERGQ